MKDREELEQEALRVCSAEICYDLADNLDSTTDEQLRKIIAARGNYKKELEVA